MLMAMKNHFGALGWQSVDDQRAYYDAGRPISMVEHDLVEAFLEMNGDAAEHASVKRRELQEGAVGEDIGPGRDGDHGSLVEWIRPVGQQLDTVIVRTRGRGPGGIRGQV